MTRMGEEVPADQIVGGTIQEDRTPVASGEAAPEAVSGEPEAEPSSSATVRATAEALAGLAAEVAAVARRMDELVRLGNRREELLDRLHSENQRLRAGETAQVQAPVLREMIRSYDLVLTLAREGSTAGPDLDLVGRRLLDGLEQSGVRSLHPEGGEAFDAECHAAVERVDTPQPDLDMTVARTVRLGFKQDGGRILRPADVAVRRYRADAGTTASAVEPTSEVGGTLPGEE